MSSYASGLFSKISYNTDKNLKKTIGKVAYYLNGLTELTNIKKFDLKMQIFDGKDYEDIEEKAILFMILNGKSVAGFDEIIYNADVNDEFLHILIVKNIDNPLDISKTFLDLLNNNLMNNDYVRILKIKSCKIKKIEEKIGVSIDGERGRNQDVNIKVISGKLKIFY